MGVTTQVMAAVEKPIKSMDGNWEYLMNEDGTITTSDYLGKLLLVSVPLQIDGKTVRAVGERTFEGCKDIISIVVPNGIKEIGNFAFNDCARLEEVSLPDTLTEISDFLFDDCISLTNITIPNSVTKIGVCAFYGCSGLQKVVLPDGVTSIGNRAFSRCKELQSVTIPESVLNIGDLAFEGNLGSVTIYTTSGSYAEKYAKDRNIAVQIIEKPNLPTQTPDIYNPVTPQPASQTQAIRAKSVTKTYGSKPFFLNATTSGDGTLSYSVANKKVVTVSLDGKVTIKGYGRTTITIKASQTTQYQGATKKIIITVIPKAPAECVVMSSPDKTKIAFIWKPRKNMTGYQIRLSTDKNFKKGVMSQQVNGKTSSIKFSARRFKKKKNYYIKIRAYKKVNNVKYYSTWSITKKIKRN